MIPITREDIDAIRSDIATLRDGKWEREKDMKAIAGLLIRGGALAAAVVMSSLSYCEAKEASQSADHVERIIAPATAQ
jgi:hypothetical protein